MNAYQVTLFEKGTGNTRVVTIRSESAEDAMFIARNHHCQVYSFEGPIWSVQHIEAQEVLPTEKNVTTKPELGIRPKWIVREHRIGEILDALDGYSKRKVPFPNEWVMELRGLFDELLSIGPDPNFPDVIDTAKLESLGNVPCVGVKKII